MRQVSQRRRNLFARFPSAGGISAPGFLAQEESVCQVPSAGGIVRKVS